MNKRTMLIALLAVGSFAFGAEVGRLSRAIRAFQMREEIEFEIVRPYADMVGGVAFLKAERMKNWLKRFATLPSVGEIVSVSIGSTSDTRRLIITLTDVDGKSSTIWTTGSVRDESCSMDGVRVSSISNY